MGDYLSLQLERQEANRAKRDAVALQQAKLKALQDTIGTYGNFRYVNLNDFLDPDNRNWQDYKWSRLPAFESAKRQEHINAGTPVGMLIQQIRDAENIDDVKKQLELWNTYKPLDSSDNGTSYIRSFYPGFGAYRNTPSIGSKPVFPTTDGSDSAQTTAGGTQGTQGAQGVQGTQDVQGVQAGAKTGNAVAGGGVQGSNNGSGGTLASAGVAKGGTKTIGYDPYDPNPGGISLAYTLRNAPEQERRTALINAWNKEHGISYVTGKDGVIYRTDPQHPNGYVDPFKNDLSTWVSATRSGSTGYATNKGMLTSSSNGSYSSQEGIETPMPANASGRFKVAWKDPMSIIGHYGRGAFTDDEYNQLVNHAVNDLGFSKDTFSGNIYR